MADCPGGAGVSAIPAIGSSLAPPSDKVSWRALPNRAQTGACQGAVW